MAATALNPSPPVSPTHILQMCVDGVTHLPGCPGLRAFLGCGALRTKTREVWTNQDELGHPVCVVDDS